ncbi:MAG: hypothetical protein HY961_03905 [Ignavibacteriae bacterium]|nr:hypothetical protein [Ignavibacteriota bacterium]
MDWQQASSLVIVATTAVLLVRHQIAKRRRAKLKPCGGNCGCSSDVLERIRAESQPKFLEQNQNQ